MQGNDLYIAGESYAGIYVPKLAKKIDDYINTKPSGYVPNLKGFLVGNPVTDYLVDGKPMQFEMAYWYGLIDDQLYMNVNKNCNLSFYDFDAGLLPQQCTDWMNTFNSKISGINLYDFIGKCWIEPQPSSGLNTKTFSVNDYTSFAAEAGKHDHKLEMIPNCVYALPIYYYLNNRTVMDALHVPSNVTKWDLCQEKGSFLYTKNRTGSIDIYSQLRGKYRVLVYSGDTDGVVPTYGTKRWIERLNWPLDQGKTWKQFMVDGQVGGYSESRDNGKFVFATIHGAGHMAPQWRRSYTYHVVYQFIKN